MVSRSDILISQSYYLAGLRCDKLLWCTYNKKDLLPEVSKAAEGRFAQEHEMGELAKLLFLGGQEAAPGKYSAEDTVALTKELVKKRIPIFGVGFVYDSAYVKVDILNPVGSDEWDIYEVKGCTSFMCCKHVDEVTFQKYAVQGNGLKVRNCYLMHVNSQYRRQGDVDPATLLKIQDISFLIWTCKLNLVVGDLQRMQEVIRQDECPDVPVGFQCLDVSTCDLYQVYWGELPEHHPGTLYPGRNKGLELLYREIIDLRDIGENIRLSARQKIQVDAIKRGEVHRDVSQVNDFLGQLEYPLAFLDFGTLVSAVPLYDGVRPLQHIPFQFSLLGVDQPGADPVHYAFLAEGTEDPRPKLLAALKAAMPLAGSVVAYNSSFEEWMLRGLAYFDPTCRTWVEDVNSRIVDLMEPFRSFAFYNPAQHGSISMKAVLPALTGRHYEDIDMSGDEAGYEFIRINFGNVEDEEVRKVCCALEEYCRQNTEGMIHIIEKLQELP